MCYNEIAKSHLNSRGSEPWHILTQSSIRLLHFFLDLKLLIELFFKWIKQNLKVKTFLGTFCNAILTQLWIALCVYLLLSFLKFKAKLGTPISQILRLLQLNLFDKRKIMDILKPPYDNQQPVSPQLSL